jgi:hypothetical protein
MDTPVGLVASKVSDSETEIEVEISSKLEGSCRSGIEEFVLGRELDGDLEGDDIVLSRSYCLD